MTETEQPQIYLITPPVIDLAGFPATLARVLDGVDIACIRLQIASRDEDTVLRAADALREVAHVRDVALVIADHLLLAQRLGLDGVHLGDAARSVREARKVLGADAIVGSFCGTSRHDGISAAEAGADYVSFGPVAASALGAGAFAADDFFQWWSEMIEVPVVAEGGLSVDAVARLAPVTDFFGIGAEIWDSADPLATLRALTAAIG
jgi:thiamine-phosphate pyrophosphorylase